MPFAINQPLKAYIFRFWNIQTRHESLAPFTNDSSEKIVPLDFAKR